MGLPLVKINGDRFSLEFPQSEPNMTREDLRMLSDEFFKQEDLLPLITSDVWRTTRLSEPGMSQECIEKFWQGRFCIYAAVNPAQGPKSFCEAANGGLPEAMYELARCCRIGVGVQKSEDTAKQVFLLVADKCMKVVKANAERTPRERMLASYIHALCCYNLAKPEAALSSFRVVNFLITKQQLDAPEITAAANVWIGKIQQMQNHAT